MIQGHAGKEGGRAVGRALNEKWTGHAQEDGKLSGFLRQELGDEPSEKLWGVGVGVGYSEVG